MIGASVSDVTAKNRDLDDYEVGANSANKTPAPNIGTSPGLLIAHLFL